MLLEDKLLLQQEGEIWILYRISEKYGKCPIFQSKNKEQVSWMFSLDIENKNEEEILKEMKSNTRNTIKKAEKIGIKIKELSKEELPEFNKIMK